MISTVSRFMLLKTTIDFKEKILSVFASSQHGKPILLKGNFINNPQKDNILWDWSRFNPSIVSAKLERVHVGNP